MNEPVADIRNEQATDELAAHANARPSSLRLVLPAMIVLLVVAGAFRLHLAWWKGHLGDLLCFQSWAVGDLEWTAVTPGPPIPIPNHPPLYLSITRSLYWLHEALHLPGNIHVPIDDFSLEHVRPIMVLYKTPAILADLTAGVILFAWALRQGRRWSALGVVAFYLFSPAILYDGAYFGQTDTILSMFLIGAAFAYVTRRPVMLASFMMLAIFLKAQAVAALPVLAAAIVLEWRTIWAPHARRLLLAAGATTAGVVAFAAVTGNLIQFYRGYFAIIGGEYARTTLNAMNLWWLLTRPWHKAPGLRDFPADTDRVLGLVSYRTLGLIAFAIALAFIIRRWHLARRRPGSLVLACAAAGWAFFNLCTEMHERYSVPAVALTCVAVLWDRRWYLYGTLASVTTMLNIVYVTPLYYPPWWWLQSRVNWFIWPEYTATHVAMAVLEVLMLLVVMEALWKAGRQPYPPTPGDLRPSQPSA